MRWIAFLLAGAAVVFTVFGLPGAAVAGGAMTRRYLAHGDVIEIIERINASEFGGWFDVADVMAVIQIESSFDATAYRAEPQISDASRGLMQVLLMVARDRGYHGEPEGLFDPETNIRIGMAHLKWSFDYLENRRGSVSEMEWISSYNAGVGFVSRGGLRVDYFNKWQAARSTWRARLA